MRQSGLTVLLVLSGLAIYARGNDTVAPVPSDAGVRPVRSSSGDSSAYINSRPAR